MLYKKTYVNVCEYPKAPSRSPIYEEASTENLISELLIRLEKAKETTALIEDYLQHNWEKK